VDVEESLPLYCDVGEQGERNTTMGANNGKPRIIVVHHSNNNQSFTATTTNHSKRKSPDFYFHVDGDGICSVKNKSDRWTDSFLVPRTLIHNKSVFPLVLLVHP
jgi:hypothetical protein